VSDEAPKKASPADADEADADEANASEANAQGADAQEADAQGDEAAEDEAAAAPAPKKKAKSEARRARRKGARPSSKRATSDDATSDDATSDDATSDDATSDDGERAGARREDVPAFAQSFPRDAALDALLAAFEAGDYGKVRKEAPLLAKSAEDPAVRKAAAELRRRLDPDPIAVYLLGAAALLLVFLAGWFWSHPHQLP
jgi:cobalamin biosynthesis Mg chelatase CobN